MPRIGSGHHSGVAPKPDIRGRSLNTHACGRPTSCRNQYAAVEMGTPITAARASSRRYSGDRSRGPPVDAADEGAAGGGGSDRGPLPAMSPGPCQRCPDRAPVHRPPGVSAAVPNGRAWAELTNSANGSWPGRWLRAEREQREKVPSEPCRPVVWCDEAGRRPSARGGPPDAAAKATQHMSRPQVKSWRPSRVVQMPSSG